MKNEINIEKVDIRKGVVALIILDVVGACMGIFARILEQDFMLFQQVAFRLLSAFIIINIIFSKQIDYKKIKYIPKRDWIIITFRSISMYLIGITLASIAFINGKYSNISFVGAALISTSDMTNILKWDNSNILALIAIVFVSLSNILRKYHTDVLNDKEITVYMLFISMLIMFCMSGILGEDITSIDWNMNLLIVIFLAGLFNGIFIFMANYGFSKVNSILANNILAAQSVFGVIIGYILYNESVTIKEVIGGLLIIISIVLFNKIKWK